MQFANFKTWKVFLIVIGALLLHVSGFEVFFKSHFNVIELSPEKKNIQKVLVFVNRKMFHH